MQFHDSNKKREGCLWLQEQLFPLSDKQLHPSGYALEIVSWK